MKSKVNDIHTFNRLQEWLLKKNLIVWFQTHIDESHTDDNFDSVYP